MRHYSTVQSADQIAVLGDGGVLEVGTHDELMRSGPNGAYSQLVNSQRLSFADA